MGFRGNKFFKREGKISEFMYKSYCLNDNDNNKNFNFILNGIIIIFLLDLKYSGEVGSVA